MLCSNKILLLSSGRIGSLQTFYHFVVKRQMQYDIVIILIYFRKKYSWLGC